MTEIEAWWYTCRKVTCFTFPFTSMMNCAQQEWVSGWIVQDGFFRIDR